MLLAVQNAPVLRRLGQEPPLESIQDLADAIGRDRSNVSKSLAALEGEGLVRVVTVDGKRRHELTSEGRDLLPRLDVLEGVRNVDLNSLELDHAQVEPDPLNPRKSFPSESLAELADSIELRLGQGKPPLIQPIAVKPTEDPAIWRIVDGERRWRAIGIVMQRGAWPEGQKLSAIIRAVEDDLDHELTSLIANEQAENMNPIESALAIERQIAGGRRVGELAQALGKTRRFVEKRRQLLRLPAILQVEVAKGVLPIEKALAHVQEHREPQGDVITPAEVRAQDTPAPQAAAGAPGPDLTPAQALIMIEVAIACDRDEITHSDLGPSARTPKPVDLTKHRDAQALMSAGLLAFWGQWPSVVSILKPGLDWLQTNVGLVTLDALRRGLQDAGIMPFEIEQLEAEDRYHTPWLNEPAKRAEPKPPEISDAAALILLELEDAVSKQPSYYAYVRPDVDREAVREICGDMIGFQGPHHQDGRRYAWPAGDATRALRGRWPHFEQGGEAFAQALAEIRAKVIPAKDLKLLEKRGGYATAWLNGPFEPDPQWLADRERMAQEQAQREREKAEREEWIAHVAEAIEVFLTNAPDMTEAQLREEFNFLLGKARCSAPWTAAEPSAQGRFFAKTADEAYVGLQSSANSHRLAIIGINIAAGIPAKDWPAPLEDEEPAAAATRACASCGGETPEDDLDEDGACRSCVEEAEDHEAAEAALSAEG